MERYEYETVVDKLSKMGTWPFAHELIPLSVDERVVKIEEVLLLAAQNHHDEGVLSAWEILATAIFDVHFMPLTTEGQGGKRFRESSQGWNEATAMAKVVQAKAACEILVQLPRCKERQEEKYDDYEHKYVKVLIKDPTLSRSKAALAERMAMAWRELEDDVVANQFFISLVDFWLDKSTLQADKEIVEKALRDASSPGFPPVRLERKIVELVPLSDQGLDTARGLSRVVELLAGGWNRGSRYDYTARVIHVSSVLRDASDAAYHWLTLQAQTIAAVDQEVRVLLGTLGHKALLHWDSPELAVVRIELDSSNHFDRNDREHPFQKPGNDVFDRARVKIVEWRQGRKNIKVRLEVVIPQSKYNGDQTPLFVRTDVF